MKGIKIMGRMIKGKLIAGWTIAYPTIGTNGRFKATSAVRPGAVKFFKNLSDACRWCEVHDVELEDMTRAEQGGQDKKRTKQEQREKERIEQEQRDNAPPADSVRRRGIDRMYR